MNEGAQILKSGVLSNQVCVPEDWTDEQICDFVNKFDPCEAFNGWYVAKEGDSALKDPTTGQMTSPRVPCSSRKGFIHVVVTC